MALEQRSRRGPVRWAVALVVACAGCADAAPDVDASPPGDAARALADLVTLDSAGAADDGAAPDSSGAPDAGATGDAAAAPDLAAPPDLAAAPDLAAPPDLGTYRTSLAVCWTDAKCPRALSVSHGGDWNALGPPYDSDGALAAAWKSGADGVKIDVRVTKDAVPVIAHSSPIEIYESLDCATRKIEDMTAKEVTGCHRAPSTSEKFQRLDTVLGFLRGKLVAELTVKRAVDYARTIEIVRQMNAQDFAYLEIGTSDLLTLIPKIPGSGDVWYLVNVNSDLSEIAQIVKAANPRAFMVEIDPGVAIGNLVATQLHPAGMRAFTYDKSSTATVKDFKAHYDRGYDVVSSNLTASTIAARKLVNQAHGVTPP